MKTSDIIKKIYSSLNFPIIPTFRTGTSNTTLDDLTILVLDKQGNLVQLPINVLEAGAGGVPTLQQVAAEGNSSTIGLELVEGFTIPEIAGETYAYFYKDKLFLSYDDYASYISFNSTDGGGANTFKIYISDGAGKTTVSTTNPLTIFEQLDNSTDPDEIITLSRNLKADGYQEFIVHRQSLVNADYEMRYKLDANNFTVTAIKPTFGTFPLVRVGGNDITPTPTVELGDINDLGTGTKIVIRDSDITNNPVSTILMQANEGLLLKLFGGSGTITLQTKFVTGDFFQQFTGAAGQIPVLGNVAPASATAAGEHGELRVAGGFLYICTAPNTWVRTAVASW